MSRRRSLVVTLAAASAVATGPASAAAPSGGKPRPTPPPPAPGALALGDSLFPTLGNGGYDAQAYDFDLTFGAGPTDPVTGTETLFATATQALSSFALDLGPAPRIGGVTVNGAPASFSRTDEKLIITPRKPLPARAPFVVRVMGLQTSAARYDADDPAASIPFVGAPSGSFTAGQPAYMHLALPVNDHPLDKAAYTFRLTAPQGRTAFASGVVVGKQRSKGGATTVTYLQRQPMAAELIQLGSGDYRVIDQGIGSGVKLRSIVAAGAGTVADDLLADNARQMAWVVRRLGRYPFDTYGVLVPDADPQFALETQTISMIPGAWFDPTEGDPEPWLAPTMVHELVHQWYGDSVSPRDWADIWINEGHATWYEALYAADEGYFEDYSGFPDLDAFAQRIYELGDRYRARFGPVGKPLSGSDDDLFSPQSYYGGFLVLYALRQEIGTTAFERLERDYVTRYRGQTRGTADFIALASQVARRDLSGFMNAWLYGTSTPPMPGHPDWAAEPYPAPTTSAVARTAAPASDPFAHAHPHGRR